MLAFALCVALIFSTNEDLWLKQQRAEIVITLIILEPLLLSAWGCYFMFWNTILNLLNMHKYLWQNCADCRTHLSNMSIYIIFHFLKKIKTHISHSKKLHANDMENLL